MYIYVEKRIKKRRSRESESKDETNIQRTHKTNQKQDIF